MPTTPVDTPISGLPPNPGVTASDLIETVDVSDTTNNNTGENKKSTVAGLVTGLPVMGASGAGHAAGLVGDPGATPGTSKFWREDATFAVPAGSGGGAGTPGGGTGDIQVNNAGAFGGLPIVGLGQGGTGQATAPLALKALLPSQAGAAAIVLGSDGTNAGWVAQATGGGGLTSIADKSIIANISGAPAVPVANTHPAILDAIYGAVRGTLGFFRGATLWQALAPGQPWQGLRSGGAAADPSWGNPRAPIFAVSAAGSGIAGTGAPTSIFTTGSPTLPTLQGPQIIPANRLTLMSTIRMHFWGDWNATSTQYTVSVTIAGTTVLTGISPSLTIAGSKAWELEAHINCQAVGSGSSGAVRGIGHISFVAADTATPTICTLTKAGGGGASGPTTLNTTIANAIDVLFSTPAGATYRVYGGGIYIDG